MFCCQHQHHGDETTLVSETEKADCKYIGRGNATFFKDYILGGQSPSAPGSDATVNAHTKLEQLINFNIHPKMKWIFEVSGEDNSMA